MDRSTSGCDDADLILLLVSSSRSSLLTIVGCRTIQGLSATPSVTAGHSGDCAALRLARSTALAELPGTAPRGGERGRRGQTGRGVARRSPMGFGSRSTVGPTSRSRPSTGGRFAEQPRYAERRVACRGGRDLFQRRKDAHHRWRRTRRSGRDPRRAADAAYRGRFSGPRISPRQPLRASSSQSGGGLCPVCEGLDAETEGRALKLLHAHHGQDRSKLSVFFRGRGSRRSFSVRTSFGARRALEDDGWQFLCHGVCVQRNLEQAVA